MITPIPVSKPVVVVTSAYGADRVRAQGQAYFVPIVARAGATGIEIRQELLTSLDPPLANLRETIAEQGLFSIYSIPLELWHADGTLAEEALRQAQADAMTLGAHFLKVALGHFHESCPISKLAALLSDSGPRLLIENDQTLQGGYIDPLTSFFLAVSTAGLPVGMTFDIGNWLWTKTNPHAALQVLAPYVEYVHCKGVAEDSGRLKAVPLTDSDPNWRALFTRFPPNVPRAIEFPLVGDDLEAVTRQYIAMLATV